MKEKLKTIGLSIVITLILSLIIGAITNNSIIKGAVLGVLLIATGILLLKKSKESLLIIILPAFISAVLSYLLSTQIQWVIVAAIVSFIATAKIPSPTRLPFYMILVTVFFTWIFKAADFSYGEYTVVGFESAGLFDILNKIVISVGAFGNVALYLLVIGMFYGVLHSISAYRNLLDKIVNGVKGKEGFILALIIVIIAVFTSVCGASHGILIIIPFIISLVLLMGYNRTTAAMVTIGSIAVGLIGNTFSSTYIQSEYGELIAQNGMGILNAILSTKADDFIVAKIVLLVLGIIITIIGTLAYASKNKGNNKEADALLPTSDNKKSKIWPLVVIFDLIFVVAMLSLTSWSNVFNLNWFQKATDWVTSIKIFDFPIFSKILGGVKPFEYWTIDDISVMLVLGSIVLAIIYKLNFEKFAKSIVSGAKKALKPAVLIILTYVVTITMYNHSLSLSVISPLMSNKFNILTMGIVAAISNIFTVDFYYASALILPYVTSIITDKSVYSLIALVWQVMHGFITLVGPTSVVLIAVLSYLNIPYGEWLKSNWKTIVGILALIFIVPIVVMLLV